MFFSAIIAQHPEFCCLLFSLHSPSSYGISSGTDNESSRGPDGSIMEQGEDAETEDDQVSDTDEMHDLDVDGSSAVGASESMRFYTLHISSVLPKLYNKDI